MRLIDDWRVVLRHAWSALVLALLVCLAGCGSTDWAGVSTGVGDVIRK